MPRCHLPANPQRAESSWAVAPPEHTHSRDRIPQEGRRPALRKASVACGRPTCSSAAQTVTTGSELPSRSTRQRYKAPAGSASASSLRLRASPTTFTWTSAGTSSCAHCPTTGASSRRSTRHGRWSRRSSPPTLRYQRRSPCLDQPLGRSPGTSRTAATSLLPTSSRHWSRCLSQNSCGPRHRRPASSYQVVRPPLFIPVRFLHPNLLCTESSSPRMGPGVVSVARGSPLASPANTGRVGRPARFRVHLG